MCVRDEGPVRPCLRFATFNTFWGPRQFENVQILMALKKGFTYGHPYTRRCIFRFTYC